MNTSKHIYFVRHGESETNATGFHFGADAPLTGIGKSQAKAVAERLKKYPIQRVVSSPYPRAVDTAAPTVVAFGLPLELQEVFRERKGPSLLYGLHESDPFARSVWDTIAANYGTPRWRHSDEENFEDLLARAKEGLRFLEGLPEEHIAVFSHGLTIKMIFAHVLLGDLLDGRMFWDNFIPAKNIENTGIMHLQFTENFHKTAKYWKLISWNDHAHLGTFAP